MKFKVIGAGLAGVEAAWQIANNGYNVSLYEMKPIKKSEAHKSDLFCELVCSNSLKASRIESAAGLLKEEMARLGSLTVPIARQSSVPAGGALAVDRDIFSKSVTEKIKSHPNIEVINEIVEDLELDDDTITIVATGPLTDGALEKVSAILRASISRFMMPPLQLLLQRVLICLRHSVLHVMSVAVTMIISIARSIRQSMRLLLMNLLMPRAQLFTILTSMRAVCRLKNLLKEGLTLLVSAL